MKRSIVLMAAIFTIPSSSFAKPADSDLVVPTSSAQSDLVRPDPKLNAEQDAIQKRKLNDSEISDDVAQKRQRPQKDPNHTFLVPDYDTDIENTIPSEAAQVSTRSEIPNLKYNHSAHYLAGFEIGPYSPTNLQSQAPGITYQNVYGSSPAALVQLDGEWDFFKSFGKLGLKGGLGFFNAQGQGRFVHTPGLQSDETLMLVVVPMNVGLAYHLQFWDRQLIIPYGEAGPDYFGIFEVRTDATSISQAKFGGGAAAHVAGGIQIQLDFFSNNLRWTLAHEYGISHLYLVAGVREFFALSNTYDFSAFMYEGGFKFEF